MEIESFLSGPYSNTEVPTPVDLGITRTRISNKVHLFTVVGDTPSANKLISLTGYSPRLVEGKRYDPATYRTALRNPAQGQTATALTTTATYPVSNFLDQIMPIENYYWLVNTRVIGLGPGQRVTGKLNMMIDIEYNCDCWGGDPAILDRYAVNTKQAFTKRMIFQ